MTHQNPPITLDFDNLPLVEAAVRASFASAPELTYSIVNSVAAALRQGFPQLDEPKHIEVPPGLQPGQLKLNPIGLPGALYTGNELGLSVTVHPQVAIARWSKSPRSPQKAYPRYPSLRESLWIAVEALRDASGDTPPTVSVVNMSYVNFIPTSDPAAFINTYLSNKAQLRIMDTAEQVQKLEAAWSDEEYLDLRFSVEYASANFPDGVTHGFKLTTAAGRRLQESIDAKTALDDLHASLQTFFLSLISDQAKTDWHLRGRPHA